jgi:hypothetical protein
MFTVNGVTICQMCRTHVAEPLQEMISSASGGVCAYCDREQAGKEESLKSFKKPGRQLIS